MHDQEKSFFSSKHFIIFVIFASYYIIFYVSLYLDQLLWHKHREREREREREKEREREREKNNMQRDVYSIKSLICAEILVAMFDYVFYVPLLFRSC